MVAGARTVFGPAVRVGCVWTPNASRTLIGKETNVIIPAMKIGGTMLASFFMVWIFFFLCQELAGKARVARPVGCIRPCGRVPHGCLADEMHRPLAGLMGVPVPAGCFTRCYGSCWTARPPFPVGRALASAGAAAGESPLPPLVRSNPTAPRGVSGKRRQTPAGLSGCRGGRGAHGQATAGSPRGGPTPRQTVVASACRVASSRGRSRREQDTTPLSTFSHTPMRRMGVLMGMWRAERENCACTWKKTRANRSPLGRVVRAS